MTLHRLSVRQSHSRTTDFTGLRISVSAATAAVDAETDAAIQKVMREEFQQSTVITVAHRINTIMDSNYILVMSDGRASEFDTPKTLLEQGGLFRDLVQAAQNKQSSM